MYDYNNGFYGMHVWWWVFWGVLWVSMVSFWTPVSRRRWQTIKESPLNVLKRRLASGEIDEAKYQSLKELVLKDQEPDSLLNLRKAF